MLLLGGDKTGKDDWYEKNVPMAERLFAEHLVELEKEKEDGNERTSNMRLGTLEKIIAALGGKCSFHVEFDNFNCELQMPQQMAMA